MTARYDAVGAAISEGTLYRAQAAAAGLAALWTLLSARRAAWTLALCLAAGALGALLLGRYADIGAMGPFPDMYQRCGPRRRSRPRQPKRPRPRWRRWA